MPLINTFQWLATTVRTNAQVLAMAYKPLQDLTPGYNLSLILEHSPCSLLTEHWRPCCSWQFQSKLYLRAFSLTLPSAWNPFLSYRQGSLHHFLQAGRVSSWEKPFLVTCHSLGLCLHIFFEVLITIWHFIVYLWFIYPLFFPIWLM